MYYHLNGELVRREEAHIHVDDRGFRYGDGAFETCRAYGGTIFRWNRHLERLKRTCEYLEMPEIIPDDLTGRINETLQANEMPDAYVRVSLTRGVQEGKLTPLPASDPTVLIVVKSLPRGGVNGTSVWDDPAVVRTVETRRIPDYSIPADAKTHNYLNGILARLELRNSQPGTADECLMKDLSGIIAEGATSNIFFVNNSVVKTPKEGAILPGITRETVIDLANQHDIQVETGSYTLDDVHRADEVFLTNTTWEVRPVQKVDDVSYGTGYLTSQLAELYRQEVETRCYST